MFYNYYEIFFQILDQKRSFLEFITILLLIFLIHFFNLLLDSIEKYLLEYDFLNPFLTLMLEGFFGTILTSIYSIIENPFKDLKQYYNENKIISFIFLILCLFLYLLLCGGRNAYRVVTNKIYSLMTKSLTDYIFNPLLMVYYFIVEDDFKTIEKEGQNNFYFVFNLILSIIIVFCALVYNELCYDLGHDTHSNISKRAKTIENIEMLVNQNDEDSDDEKNDDNSNDY